MTVEKEWFEPGIFEVAKGVYRIPLPMPNDGLTAVNVYAIDDGKGLTMIDGGWSVAASRSALEAALKQLGATPKAITRILVTHIHRDHYTLAVELRKDYGMPISLGIGERPMLEELVQGKMTHLGRQIEMLRGAGAAELADQVAKIDKLIDLSEGWALPDEWLEPGPIDLGTRSVRVLATPGHTKGHIVFVEEESGLLFAGDHVLPKITPSIGFEGRPSPEPLKEFLTSLAKVKALPDLRLLPAHGPVAESTHARVVELVAHHDARLAEMRACLGTEKTAFEVANNVGWTRHKRALVDLTPFNQMLAILETQAHLHLLVTSGLATSRVDAGVTLYETA